MTVEACQLEQQLRGQYSKNPESEVFQLANTTPPWPFESAIQSEES
jgi:hypothetical protein